MTVIKKQTLENAYKPYDVVTDKKGNVGFIQEVDVNTCQPYPKQQILYAVNWIVGGNFINAWFKHSDLKRHCNLLIEIAECSASSSNRPWVSELFKNIKD